MDTTLDKFSSATSGKYFTIGDETSAAAFAKEHNIEETLRSKRTALRNVLQASHKLEIAEKTRKFEHLGELKARLDKNLEEQKGQLDEKLGQISQYHRDLSDLKSK